MIVLVFPNIVPKEQFRMNGIAEQKETFFDKRTLRQKYHLFLVQMQNFIFLVVLALRNTVLQYEFR